MKPLTHLVAPALAAFTLVGMAAPASAQYYDRYENSREVRSEIRGELRKYERKIQRAEARGRLSHRSANWLSYRVQGVRNQFRSFRRNGIDRWEARTLYSALDNLERDFRYRMRSGDRRGYRDQRGYGGRHDGYRGRGYRDYDRNRDHRSGRYRDYD